MPYKKTLILGGIIAANSLSLNTSARQDFNLGDSDTKTELPAIRSDEKDIMSLKDFPRCHIGTASVYGPTLSA